MAQHDYNIQDQNGFDFLVDLNNGLSAIATNNAGATEPTTTFAHMFWFDTNNDLMKVRNEANTAWVIVAKKDGSGWTPYRQGVALGTASVQADDRYAHRSNNLSDLLDAGAARGNLVVAADSADTDLTNDPDAALRRDIGKAYVDSAVAADSKVKAWATFNGSGTIFASHNVSSITENQLGDFTINFANVLQDANYALTGSARRDVISFNEPALLGEPRTAISDRTSGKIRFITIDVSGNRISVDYVNAVVVR